MSVLEDKIKKNKELFDAAEPSPGHLDRFMGKLYQLDVPDSQKPARSMMPLKIAASFLFLFALGIALYLMNQRFVTNDLNASDLSPELMEVKLYYAGEANDKLEKIGQCASTPEDAVAIKEMLKSEIDMLDQNSAVLEEELKKNQDNPKVKNALIVNYKTKSELLDQILNRLCNI